MNNSDPRETLNLVYLDLCTLFDKLADGEPNDACAVLVADVMAKMETRHPGIASRLVDSLRIEEFATKLGAED